MGNPYVSIIIPVYNGQNHIRRAVQSAVSQTYPFVEVIVVNDGSTDDTGIILKQFDNIKVFNIENKGVSNARNLGLVNCIGDYIMFLDADDELFPYSVESAVGHLKQSGCDILIFRSLTAGNGNDSDRALSESTEIFGGEELLIKCLSDDPVTFSIWDKIFTRDIIGDTRFDVSKSFHEDLYFVFCLSLKKPNVALFDKYLHKRYITNNSLSRNRFEPKLIDIIQLADNKYRMIESQYPHLVDRAVNMRIKACMAMLDQFTKKGAGMAYADVRRECINYIKKNKQKFIPVSRSDKILFWAVTHNVFGLYRILQRIRREF